MEGRGNFDLEIVHKETSKTHDLLFIFSQNIFFAIEPGYYFKKRQLITVKYAKIIH